MVAIATRKWQDYSRNRRFHVNDKLFDDWTELSAYMVGVIHADGSMGDGERRHCVQIILGETDRKWLKQMADRIGFTGRIRRSKITDEYGTRFSVRIVFSSKRIWRKLSAMGIKKPTVIDQIPNAVFHHFVRGFFDGDGSVYLDRSVGNLHSNFTGNRSFLKKLRKRLNLAIGTSAVTGVHPKTNCPSTASLRYAAGDTIRLRDFMYRDASIRLNRKLRTFEGK